MDDLLKLEYINNLLSIYGGLLTESQKAMMEDYYVYNLSFAEISENNNVSRAAVSDCLKKSLQKLEYYESILHLYQKKELLSSLIKDEKTTKEELVKALERMMSDGIWISIWSFSTHFKEVERSIKINWSQYGRDAKRN